MEYQLIYHENWDGKNKADVLGVCNQIARRVLGHEDAEGVKLYDVIRTYDDGELIDQGDYTITKTDIYDTLVAKIRERERNIDGNLYLWGYDYSKLYDGLDRSPDGTDVSLRVEYIKLKFKEYVLQHTAQEILHNFTLTEVERRAIDTNLLLTENEILLKYFILHFCITCIGFNVDRALTLEPDEREDVKFARDNKILADYILFKNQIHITTKDNRGLAVRPLVIGQLDKIIQNEAVYRDLEYNEEYYTQQSPIHYKISHSLVLEENLDIIQIFNKIKLDRCIPCVKLFTNFYENHVIKYYKPIFEEKDPWVDIDEMKDFLSNKSFTYNNKKKQFTRVPMDHNDSLMYLLYIDNYIIPDKDEIIADIINELDPDTYDIRERRSGKIHHYVPKYPEYNEEREEDEDEDEDEEERRLREEKRDWCRIKPKNSRSNPSIYFDRGAGKYTPNSPIFAYITINANGLIECNVKINPKNTKNLDEMRYTIDEKFKNFIQTKLIKESLSNYNKIELNDIDIKTDNLIYRLQPRVDLSNKYEPIMNLRKCFFNYLEPNFNVFRNNSDIHYIVGDEWEKGTITNYNYENDTYSIRGREDPVPGKLIRKDENYRPYINLIFKSISNYSNLTSLTQIIKKLSGYRDDYRNGRIADILNEDPYYANLNEGQIENYQDREYTPPEDNNVSIQIDYKDTPDIIVSNVRSLNDKARINKLLKVLFEPGHTPDHCVPPEPISPRADIGVAHMVHDSDSDSSSSEESDTDDEDEVAPAPADDEEQVEMRRRSLTTSIFLRLLFDADEEYFDGDPPEFGRRCQGRNKQPKILADEANADKHITMMNSELDGDFIICSEESINAHKDALTAKNPTKYCGVIKIGSSERNENYYACPNIYDTKEQKSLSLSDLVFDPPGFSPSPDNWRKDIATGRDITTFNPRYNERGVITDFKVTDAQKSLFILKEKGTVSGAFPYPSFILHDDKNNRICCNKKKSSASKRLKNNSPKAWRDILGDKTNENKDYIKQYSWNNQIDKDHLGGLPPTLEKIFNSNNNPACSNLIGTVFKSSNIGDNSCYIMQSSSNRDSNNKFFDLLNLINGKLDNITSGILNNLRKDKFDSLTDLNKEFRDKTKLINPSSRTPTPIISAYQNFLEYTMSSAPKDYNYYWEYLTQPHPKLFPRGLNLIIIEVSEDESYNLICPNFNFKDGAPYAISLLINGSFYLIVKKTKDGDQKTFSRNKGEIIDHIASKLEEGCKIPTPPKPGPPGQLYYNIANPKIYKVNVEDKIKKLIRKINKDQDPPRYTQDANNGDSVVVNGNIYIKFGEGEREGEARQGYKETINKYIKLWRESNQELHIKPLRNVMDDTQQITGILLENGDVIQVRPFNIKDKEETGKYISQYMEDTNLYTELEIDLIKMHDDATPKDARVEAINGLYVDLNKFEHFKAEIRNQLTKSQRHELEIMLKDSYLPRLHLEHIKTLVGRLVSGLKFTKSGETGDKYENKLCEDVEICDEQAYCKTTGNIPITTGNICVFDIEDGLKEDYLDRFAKELTYNQYKRYEFIENKYFIDYNTIYKKANNEKFIVLSDLKPRLLRQEISKEINEIYETKLTQYYNDWYPIYRESNLSKKSPLQVEPAHIWESCKLSDIIIPLTQKIDIGDDTQQLPGSADNRKLLSAEEIGILNETRRRIIRESE
jgi:hypothetical protein